MSSLSGANLTKGKPLTLDVWVHGSDGELSGCGSRGLLTGELTAFFASRQCPGTAIRAAMDWALQQARARRAVISGFHSPLEQSVLKVLIAARSPAVVVLARPLQGARLPSEWSEPLAQGQLAVVSHVTTANRLTRQLADARNALAAQLAEKIVVAHVSSGGSLASLLQRWREDGRQVDLLLNYQTATEQGAGGAAFADAGLISQIGL